MSASEQSKNNIARLSRAKEIQLQLNKKIAETGIRAHNNTTKRTTVSYATLSEWLAELNYLKNMLDSIEY